MARSKAANKAKPAAKPAAKPVAKAAAAKPTAVAKQDVAEEQEEQALETYRGPDGSKSPGYELHPPKPGLATDADDAGRGGEKLV